MLNISRKRPAEVLDDDSSSAYHYDNSAPKSGKWTVEEETFANKLIVEFEAGSLSDCADGCTLRAYLSRKLNCAPMRISKKYAGQCIGKHAYSKKLPDEVSGDKDAHRDVFQISRDSDSPSASTSSAASSDSSTISELEHAAEARRAEVSFGTLAEFQLYNYPQGGVHYARNPITLMSLQPGGAMHPTPLYPVPHFAASTQPWMTYEDYRPCAVVQRPCEPDSQHDAVGLDIDDPYQMGGCGVHSVSTDYSSVTSSSASTDERYIDVGRRTPEASPNLISAQIQLSSATAKAPGQQVAFVTPVLQSVVQGQVAMAKVKLERSEAEEWRAVLSYFTQPSAEGVPVASAEEEENGRMVRRDSSFLLHRNTSYSSLFV